MCGRFDCRVATVALPDVLKLQIQVVRDLQFTFDIFQIRYSGADNRLIQSELQSFDMMIQFQSSSGRTGCGCSAIKSVDDIREFFFLSTL